MILCGFARTLAIAAYGFPSMDFDHVRPAREDEMRRCARRRCSIPMWECVRPATRSTTPESLIFVSLLYCELRTSHNTEMIYAETKRLVLRSLARADLPRLAELIGDWDVARWLAAVPYPYRLTDAEDFYERMEAATKIGGPEYFVMRHKNDGPIGAIGVHAAREPQPQPGELVIGYWLGKRYWNQGFMSEAIRPVIDITFARAEVAALTATTDPDNSGSQSVLRKVGLRCIGLSPRRDPAALRGSLIVTRWQMTRADYERERCTMQGL
jgi:8-oxo-dGTP diphosphatase